MSHSCTLRYNPAGKHATKKDYDAVLKHLGDAFSNYVYEKKQGYHMHGTYQEPRKGARFPRLSGYHIWLRKFTEEEQREHWKTYLKKENDDNLSHPKFKYPNFNINKLSSSAEHVADAEGVQEAINDSLKISSELYANAPYPFNL